MAAWSQYGVRIDIALAVVMEVAVLKLSRADSDAARAQAIAFNEALWRVVKALAANAPVEEDRTALRNAATLILAGGRRLDQLTELNRSFARLLAGRAATDGALGHILDRWRTARRAGTDQEFGPWLLDLLDGFAFGRRQSLAA